MWNCVCEGLIKVPSMKCGNNGTSMLTPSTTWGDISFDYRKFTLSPLCGELDELDELSTLTMLQVFRQASQKAV
jgi:hypothetical protein